MKTRTQLLLLFLGALLALAVVPAAGAETGGLRTIGSAEAESTQIEAEPGAGLAWSASKWGGATWYGPGFYGHRTACGQTLRKGTIGVAHRNLPCGTAVRFVYHGTAIVAPVIDRGPYAKGFSWDLTNGARERLGFEGSGRIRYAVEMSYARRR